MKAANATMLGGSVVDPDCDEMEGVRILKEYA